MSELKKEMKKIKQSRDRKVRKMIIMNKIKGKMKSLLFVGAILVITMVSGNSVFAADKPSSWTDLSIIIEANYKSMIDSYKTGDEDGAFEYASDNYFNIFDSEEFAMEQAIAKNFSDERAAEIEHYFHTLIQLVQDDTPFDELDKIVKECISKTKAVALELDNMNVSLP